MGKQKRKEIVKANKSDDENRSTESGGATSEVINEITQEVSAAHTVKSRPIFILEDASLEVGLVRKKRKILSSSEDSSFLLKQGRNPNNYRPDIFFEALRAILDSPLNKVGMVGAVYAKTNSGVVLEVKPHTRIPRTCKRFCGLMVELFQKSCVRAKDTGEVLIRVLQGPLTQHIPENARVIGLSYSSEKVVDIEDYVSTLPDELDVVFVVGTMANGKVSQDGKDDYISVSHYPLGAKCCAGLICEALEQKWNI
ncbi:unnamed protein product [Cuscuta campestris]|uniref:Ribosomal RNA small subunit methyltransferase NEP1 n=1 Tax=Cuscuta campestris TaxID=132261 RepID=A0A484KT53_9ASTE|nr:unnamed protein product [Cuscuta campestris]